MFERSSNKIFNIVGTARSGHHFLSHILVSAFEHVWYCNNIACSENTIKSAKRKLQRRKYASKTNDWMGHVIEEQSYDYVFSTYSLSPTPDPNLIQGVPVFLLGEHCSVDQYRDIQRNIEAQNLPSTTLLSLRSPKNCFASWLKLVGIHPKSRHQNDDFNINARSIDFIQTLKEQRLSILEKRVSFIPVFYDELISNNDYYDSLVNLVVEPTQVTLERCRQVKKQGDNTAWQSENTSTNYLNRAQAEEIVKHPIFQSRIKELEEVEDIHEILKTKILS